METSTFSKNTYCTTAKNDYFETDSSVVLTSHPPHDPDAMMPRSHDMPQKGYTLLELMIVLTVCSVLATLSFPVIQKAREEARRQFCVSHMKQQAHAVHQYCETQKGLTPISIGEQRASFWVLIFPYMNRPDLYTIFTRQPNGIGSWIKGDVNAGKGGWWGGDLTIGTATEETKLTEQDRHALASVSVFLCPTRRSGDQRAVGNWAPGPCIDYACVVAHVQEEFVRGRNRDPIDNYYSAHNQSLIDRCQGGALRAAVVPTTEVGGATKESENLYLQFTPRDTLERISDGTSCTIMIGEKHIHPDALNRATTFPLMYKSDGSYLWGGGQGSQRNCSYARAIRHSHADNNIVRQPKLYKDSAAVFGSYHPGVANFVFVDGSVKALSASTPFGVLINLARAADGQKVSLD